MTGNKVKFNIKNVHYAVKDSEGEYSVPVALPGAVSLSLEQQGELSPFFADGIKYYVSATNGGYEGDLEVALVTDEFRQAILGEVLDGNKVMFENTNTPTVEFALGFDIDGDQKTTKFWFYNCTATRPSIEAETVEDTTEPGTDTITISCAPTTEGIVRAKTTAETTEAIASDWYKAVYVKADTPVQASAKSK